MKNYRFGLTLSAGYIIGTASINPYMFGWLIILIIIGSDRVTASA